MNRLLKEPLLQFLLLGAVIFTAYTLVSERNPIAAERIVITQGQIEHLAISFTKVWSRPPSAEELLGLVRDRVREEVYCREAMALGLDRGDTVIRRRLRQKMEFLSNDIAALVEPTDTELAAFLHSHPDAFRVEQQFTFRQVCLDPRRRGERLESDIGQLLVRLNQAGGAADVSALGDLFLLECDFAAVPASEIARQFGAAFASRLHELTPGRWEGPVESGYGVHLVLISERTETRMPAIEEVRDAVRRDWDNARRLESNELFYQQLLSQYEVTIEGLVTTAKPVEMVASQAR